MAQQRYYIDCPNHGPIEVRKRSQETTYIDAYRGPLKRGLPYETNKEANVYRDSDLPRREGGYGCPAGDSGKLKTRTIFDTFTRKGDKSRTQCGPKCQNAIGPNCDCHCQGANHGYHFANG